MPISVACNHNTSYKFDKPVLVYPHVVRLRPAPHIRTPIHAYSLKVFPEKHFINWQQDAFGNYLARLVFLEKTHELRIDVEVIADMNAYNPLDFFIEEYAENCPLEYCKLERSELSPYSTTRRSSKKSSNTCSSGTPNIPASRPRKPSTRI